MTDTVNLLDRIWRLDAKGQGQSEGVYSNDYRPKSGSVTLRVIAGGYDEAIHPSRYAALWIASLRSQ